VNLASFYFILTQIQIPSVHPNVNFLKTTFSRWPLNSIDPKIYLNQGVKSIFFALKPDSSTSFPIGQLTYILEREKAKTLIKIEVDEDRITAALKNSENIKDRVGNLILYLFRCFKI
jgi:hypothetical protein